MTSTDADLMRELADAINRANEERRRLEVIASRKAVEEALRSLKQMEFERRIKLKNSAMTVRHLQKLLSEMDPDAKVWVVGDDYDTTPLRTVTKHRDGVILED